MKILQFLGAPPSQRNSNNETAALIAQVAGINRSQSDILNVSF